MQCCTAAGTSENSVLRETGAAATDLPQTLAIHNMCCTCHNVIAAISGTWTNYSGCIRVASHTLAFFWSPDIWVDCLKRSMAIVGVGSQINPFGLLFTIIKESTFSPVLWNTCRSATRAHTEPWPSAATLCNAEKSIFSQAPLTLHRSKHLDQNQLPDKKILCRSFA